MKNIIHPHQWELLAAMVCYTVTDGTCVDCNRLGGEDYKKIADAIFAQKETVTSWFTKKPAATCVDSLITYTSPHFGYITWEDFADKERQPDLQLYFDSLDHYAIIKKAKKKSPTQEQINQLKDLQIFAYRRVYELLAQNNAETALGRYNQQILYNRLLAKVSFRLKRPTFGLQMRQIYRTMRCIELKI